jgi:hypothetical protein
MLWHAVEFWNRVKKVDPRLLRTNKYLPAWYRFIPLGGGLPQIRGQWEYCLCVLLEQSDWG